MPKFFVPNMRGSDAEQWWQTDRARAEATGAQCSSRRIYQLRHADGQVVAEVGKRADMGGETKLVVAAIFDAVDSYVLAALIGTIHSIPSTDLEPVDFETPTEKSRSPTID